MAYRYYSTLRPLMVGGIPFPKQPGESITTIVSHLAEALQDLEN